MAPKVRAAAQESTSLGPDVAEGQQVFVSVFWRKFDVGISSTGQKKCLARTAWMKKQKTRIEGMGRTREKCEAFLAGLAGCDGSEDECAWRGGGLEISEDACMDVRVASIDDSAGGA